jgi:glycosyltransferase involved in cell wall biosynthesis
MKIAMVSEHASPLAALGGVDSGGQNVHVAELSAALARLGHSVTVYTRRDDPDLPDQAATPFGVGVEHVPAGPPRTLAKDALLTHMGEFGRWLADRWRGDRPDVVHAHFWMSGLAALAGGRDLDLPVVQTFHALGTVKRRHQGAEDTSPAARLRLEAAVARSVRATIATCTDELFELARMGVRRDRVTVVPCGVDTERFAPGGPVADRSGRPRLVSVGRLVPRKGFDTVISALRGLPGVELLIAGGPPAEGLPGHQEARRLRAHAEDVGVADRVRLLGAVDRARMPDLLRSADVVVCTPWYEPFGIVPLEAMACGIPVVASAVGGLTDTVVDGVTGLHVPPRRPDRLAVAVRTLLSDPVRRLGFGIAGADRARSRFTWERVAVDTARVYGRVLAEARTDIGDLLAGGSR